MGAFSKPSMTDTMGLSVSVPREQKVSMPDKKAESLHEVVSDSIRDKIYGNEWPQGTQIPSEYELANEFGVSRSTVQKALLKLSREGLLNREKGRGTFVAKPDLQYATGWRFLSFAESLHLQGIDFQTQVLMNKVLPATQVDAEHLCVSLGSPVLHLHRLRSDQGGPILYQESRVNLSACPGAERVDFSQKPLFDAMETTSERKISYSRARYAARVAGKKRGELLGCDSMMPILNVDMTVHLEDNTVVEWVNIWLPSNKYVLASVMHRV